MPGPWVQLGLAAWSSRAHLTVSPTISQSAASLPSSSDSGPTSSSSPSDSTASDHIWSLWVKLGLGHNRSGSLSRRGIAVFWEEDWEGSGFWEGRLEGADFDSKRVEVWIVRSRGALPCGGILPKPRHTVAVESTPQI